MPADFFDSNVLIYYFSREPTKAGRVAELLAKGCTVSVQVLNEVVNVHRRKLRLDWPGIHEMLVSLHAVAEEVLPLTLADHSLGVAIAERHNLATYDAMIVASALNAGCETLWSEDMHDGLLVEDRLRIRNPFA